MSTIGSLLPIRGNLLVLCLAGGALAATAIGFRWFGGAGELRQVASASFEQPLPQQPSNSASTAPVSINSSNEVVSQDTELPSSPPANPEFTQPEIADIKPSAPNLDLVDASPSGPLPRISNDGRLPLTTYARPFDTEDERPKIAIIVTGLGPQIDATNASFHLPAAISLSFSPYTEDLPSLFERARLAGHEVLLELPMEPDNYPTDDPGPHTLRASGTSDANLERLIWVLSRAPGYFAVAGSSGAFGKSPEAAPIAKEIASKGLGFIEIDGNKLEGQADNADLAYITTQQWIDETPSADAIKNALADLEAKAKAEGGAIGVAEAYPITLQHLVDWSAELNSRGILLVPVSAILIERQEQLGGDDQDSGSNVAQSQN